MELRINCDASVKLKKINGTRKVNCNVIDYKIQKDTLNGNIMIDGTYLKDDLDKEYEFSELVPFTVVFRDENFEVTDIQVENFNNNDIVNQSVDCHFDIVIYYEERNESKKEKKVDKQEKEVKEEAFEEIKSSEEVTDDQEISNKYDEMLQEILTGRKDNFLEEIEEVVIDKQEQILKEILSARVEEEVIEIPVEEKPKNNLSVSLSKGKEDKKEPLFKELKESYQSYSVYFINNDKQIDKICKDNNLNINDVYEDYSKNRRIIVK